MRFWPGSPLEHLRALCLLLILALCAAVVRLERQLGAADAIMTARPQLHLARDTKTTTGPVTITERVVEACPACPVCDPDAGKSMDERADEAAGATRQSCPAAPREQVIERTIQEAPTVTETVETKTETPVCPAPATIPTRFVWAGYGLGGIPEAGAGMTVFGRLDLGAGLLFDPAPHPKVEAAWRF